MCIIFDLSTRMLALVIILALSSVGQGDARAVFKKHLVDMSYDFNDETIYFPFNQIGSFNLTRVEYTLVDGVNTKRNGNYFAGEHGGTHMDAPMHFYKEGREIGEIPIERFEARAVVLDVRDEVKKDQEYSVTVEDLLKWENQHGKMPDYSIVMLCTGWDENWPDKNKFFGTDNFMNSSSWRFPGYSVELAEFLATNRTVAGIGTDAATPDGSRTIPALTVHVTVSRADIFILEYVKGVCDIPVSGATLLVFPMKIQHGSGAPTRILATWDDDGDDVCSHTSNAAAKTASRNVLPLLAYMYVIGVGIYVNCK